MITSAYRSLCDVITVHSWHGVQERCVLVRVQWPVMQDELASTIGKVDRAKQLLNFPAVDGFRFRSGSGGIFLGSKDLFISELAASFYVACNREIGPDGRPKVNQSQA